MSSLRTPTTACFCLAFKEQIFNSLSFSEMTTSWWSGWSAPLHDLNRSKLITLYLPFCQLSVIGHILTNEVLPCWADGGFEISKKSLQMVFSRLAIFPTRPCHPVSPSSLHGQSHLHDEQKQHVPLTVFYQPLKVLENWFTINVHVSLIIKVRLHTCKQTNNYCICVFIY